MKNGLVFFCLLLLTLTLVLAPTTFASTTWYVNGTTGNDSNDCLSAQAACKTIGHAISLAASGDSILVAAATYAEHLTIGTSLTIVGSDATTTIIDGGGGGTVVTIYGTTVRLSHVTVRNGYSGIHSSGTPTISYCIISRNLGGGGIINDYHGTLIIKDSTVSGNSQRGDKYRGGQGGGIENFGTMTISWSNITGNSVGGVFGAAVGGGIANQNSGTATVSNSTVSGNHAPAAIWWQIIFSSEFAA